MKRGSWVAMTEVKAMARLRALSTPSLGEMGVITRTSAPSVRFNLIASAIMYAFEIYSLAMLRPWD